MTTSDLCNTDLEVDTVIPDLTGELTNVWDGRKSLVYRHELGGYFGFGHWYLFPF